MKTSIRVLFLAAAVLCLGLVGCRRNGTAEKPQLTWPQRTVTLIVPTAVGTGADFTARLYATKLQEIWGKPVVVDNRAGAGDGVLGFSIFAASKDDHTLLFSASSPITMDALVRDDLPYDAEKDFLPIAAVAQPTLVLAVHAALPVSDFSEFITYVRANPGRLFWSGIGRLGNFVEGLFVLEKLNMTHVPYRAPTDAVMDLAAGRLHLWISSVATVDTQVRAGKVKILAITNSRRSPSLATVPTLSELGFPQLTLDGVWGFYGRAAMPARLRDQISEDVRRASGDSELTARMSQLGVTASASTPGELEAMLVDQRHQFSNVMKLLGLTRAGKTPAELSKPKP